jgi:predicted RNase H-like HicB family nuclease
MKYVYPAIFTREESGLYSIDFPDIPHCYTSGDNETDGFLMAEDILNIRLFDIEKSGDALPTPTKIESIVPPQSGFVTMIMGDTNIYRRLEKKRAVKKTLSVPEWLAEQAVSAGLNFSRVLQDGLKRELEVEEYSGVSQTHTYKTSPTE